MDQSDLASLRIPPSQRDALDRPRRTRYVALAAVVAALFAAGWLGRDRLAAIITPAVTVELVSVELRMPRQEDALLTASGYVVAQRKAAVASKGTGRLVFLGVTEGDPVHANQVVARLEDNDIRAQLAQAEANLKLQEAELVAAEAAFRREEQLLATGASAQASYDLADAQYRRVLASIDMAEAQVEVARVALENTLIRAPFAGTVLTKNAEIGEIVAPLAAGANSRAAVVTIADMASLQVETDVSESNIDKIVLGQACEIRLDAYPSYRYAGLVAKVVPTADRAKATVLVKVAFSQYDERVLPEMSAKVQFLQDRDSVLVAEQPMLMVPVSAVVTRAEEPTVFRVVDGRAVAVPVVTGGRYGGYVEVLRGLREGEAVIVGLDATIQNGTAVTVDAP